MPRSLGRLQDDRQARNGGSSDDHVVVVPTAPVGLDKSPTFTVRGFATLTWSGLRVVGWDGTEGRGIGEGGWTDPQGMRNGAGHWRTGLVQAHRGEGPASLLGLGMQVVDYYMANLPSEASEASGLQS